MKNLIALASAAALCVLPLPSASGELGASLGVSVGGIDASVDASVGHGGRGGTEASVDIDVGGSGNDLAGVDIDLGTGGHGTGGGGTGGGGTGGGGTGGGGPGPDGTSVAAAGKGSADGGAAGTFDLRHLIGMAVVSSDRKLLGVLESARHTRGQIALTIALAPSIDAAVELVTIQTDRMPAVSEVIRLRMSYSRFVSQI
jgi:hypothetical protein